MNRFTSSSIMGGSDYAMEHGAVGAGLARKNRDPFFKYLPTVNRLNIHIFDATINT